MLAATWAVLERNTMGMAERDLTLRVLCCISLSTFSTLYVGSGLTGLAAWFFAIPSSARQTTWVHFQTLTFFLRLLPVPTHHTTALRCACAGVLAATRRNGGKTATPRLPGDYPRQRRGAPLPLFVGRPALGGRDACGGGRRVAATCFGLVWVLDAVVGSIRFADGSSAHGARTSVGVWTILSVL